jgi:hypothetical protein
MIGTLPVKARSSGRSSRETKSYAWALQNALAEALGGVTTPSPPCEW